MVLFCHCSMSLGAGMIFEGFILDVLCCGLARFEWEILHVVGILICQVIQLSSKLSQKPTGRASGAPVVSHQGLLLQG